MEAVKKKAKKTVLLIGLASFFPLFLILLLILSFVIFMGDSGGSTSTTLSTGQTIGVSEQVLRFKEPILSEMTRQSVGEEWLPLLLAIVMQESGGDSDNHSDIFQASESLGYGSPDMIDTATSIQAGVTAFKSRLEATRAIIGCEPSPTIEGDVRTILTLYNVPAYGTFLKTNYAGVWSQQATDDFYSNELPKYGVGAGDSHYSDHVLRYYSFETGESVLETTLTVGTGDGQVYFSAVMAEAVKYQGNPYAWGGSSPLQGFDCSGLVQWCYGKAGIALTRTSQSQWGTDVVEVSKEEAQAGDLVFFEGTNPAQSGMTHVGIYMGDNKMYNSQSSGIKIDDLNNWANYPTHFGRIKGN